MDLFRAHVLVCGGTGCSSSGSAELIKRFEEQIAKNGLDKEVKVVRTGCFGLCEAGPVVIVYPEGTFYSRIKVDDVDEIVSEHLLKGRIVQHLIYKEKADEEQHSTLENIDFYRPAAASGSAELRSYRPRKHRRIYCFRRLYALWARL